jgi:uncharacterized MAPEG superfamily protein
MKIAGLTVAYWAVIAAALMPILCAGLAKSGMFRTPRKAGGYDNHEPRAWLQRQTGWRARANAAQANCFEALPFFIGAVVIAHQHMAPQMRLDVLAFLWVFTRLLYVMAYVADMATVRSIVWTVALALNLAILFI